MARVYGLRHSNAPSLRKSNMLHFTQSIKFKIVLAFGLCVTLMAAVGAFGLYGMSKMNSNMADSYTGDTVPVGDLSEVRAAQLEIRLALRRAQASRDPAQTKAAIELIGAARERIDRSWNHYYPDGASSDKERRIAEEIKNLLPQFKASTDEMIAALDGTNYDAALALIDKQKEIAGALHKAIADDAQVNLSQAKQFADDSEAPFPAIRWMAVALP